MSESASRFSRVELFDTYFTNARRAEACDEIERLIAANDRCHLVCVKDVALLMRSRSDSFLRQFYERFPEYIFADGRGVVWASRLLGEPLVEMVGGPGIYYEMLRRAATKGYKVYLLGTRDDVLQRAVANLKKRLPTLSLVGCHHGYFDQDSEYRVVESILRAAPQVLFIGMSTPRREQFIATHLRSLLPGVCLPIGGVLDVEAGTTRLAPGIVGKLGLEWLYRLLQEPRRLGPRYLRTHPRFIWAVFQAVIERATAGDRVRR